MGLKMNILLAVAFILHVSAKPFAEKNICRVSQLYNCGQVKCPCSSEVTKLTNWIDFFKNIIRGSPECSCNKQCEKIVEVNCKHGTCDPSNKICACFPCWTGTTCSKYENKHKPKFLRTFTEINLVSKQSLGYIKALDKDAALCKKDIDCPCAEVRYSLVEGGDDTFTINNKSGEVDLLAEPLKDDYLLVIGASNQRDRALSKTFVQINTRQYQGRKNLLRHSRRRRSVSSGSLVLTLNPILSTVFYYNIGQTISFKISLSHNSSVSPVSVSDVKIRLSSQFLQLTTVGMSKTKNGSFVPQENMVGDVLELSLSSASFESGNRYEANITTTVKNTIAPLSNLKVSAELNATTDVYIKKTSSPVVYAVYPRVNVTQITEGAVSVYGTKNFSMSITFPKLNYSLFAELTSNIEDFIFMEITGVTVRKDSNVHYNGTATPQYFSTKNNGKNDRVLVNFGYIKNNADTNNKVEIQFSVKVLDHVLLVNNSKHWIGVGLQAGLRVLWVEQQSFIIMKEEPSLDIEVVAANYTNITRIYFGDNYLVSYTVKHTNTSTAAAKNVEIYCFFSNLVLPESEVSGNKVDRINGTAVVAKPNSNLMNPLPLGNTLSGSFNLKLASDVTPFVQTMLICTVAYKSNAGIAKDPLTKSITPPTLVGSPSIILSVDGTNNLIKPGEKRRFSVKVMLTKMRSPLRFEFVMPMVGNDSVFHISSVERAEIGENIIGLNSSAKPVFISSQNNGINNAAVYDLGIGNDSQSFSGNLTKNIITVKFDVILLDNANVTNASVHWVGAGLVGKPKMIWVGQIMMTAIVPIDSRPWLQMNTSIIPPTDGNQFSDYQYNFLLSHKLTSNQLAHNVKIRFFLPDYVQFVSMVSAEDPRLTQKQFGGSRLFEIKHPVNFPATFNITFKVQIDQSKLPHDGKVYITTPIYLLYDNRNGEEFTLVKLLQKFVIVQQKLTLPTITGVAEYYDRGISWHVKGGGSYEFYICSKEKAKRTLSTCFSTADKGDSWNAVDSRVSSILGRDSDNRVYGIAKNKRAYMMFDTTVNTWVSIPKSMVSAEANKYIKLTDAAPAGDPVSHQVIGSDHWGVSKDGVFLKKDGAGAWKKKSIWL